MSIEQYIKGSVWTTTKPIRVRGTDIPAGTAFEVMYPRRRESNLVAIKFLGEVSFNRRMNRHTSSLSRPKRGTKGRYHKADELVSATLLEGSQITSLPEVALEFFIREISTKQIWSGGRECPVGFRHVPYTEGNQFATFANARVGMITMMFRDRRPQQQHEDEVAWEVVGYDPFSGAVLEVYETEAAWWRTTVGLGRLAKSFKKQDSLDDDTKRRKVSMCQKLANLVPHDERNWVAVVVVSEPELIPHYSKSKFIERLTEAGITEYIKADDRTFLLRHDTDRVLMKLLFASAVETYLL